MKKKFQEELCLCGHSRKLHYGGISYCLFVKIGIWKCLCGYFEDKEDNSNSRNELIKNIKT